MLVLLRCTAQEPAAGTPGTTLIRIRLPDGSSHQRRFRGEDAMQAGGWAPIWVPIV